MGTITLKSIEPWKFSQIADPDAAGPIGSRASSPKKHTATRIELGPKGLTYADEVSLAVYSGEFRDLPRSLATKLNLRTVRGWLFAVTEQNAEKRKALQGSTLHFSALPHSRNQFFNGSLKPSNHKDKDRVYGRVAKALDETPAELLADEKLAVAFRQLPFCPFFEDSKGVACWMVMTDAEPSVKQHPFSQDGEYCLGITERADDLTRLLTDPFLETQLSKTRDGTIFSLYPAGKVRIEQNKINEVHGIRPMKGPVFRYVTDNAVQASENLMTAACRGALAGLSQEELGLGGDRLVSHRAAIIYQRLLYAHVKRVGGDAVLSQTTGAQSEQADPNWADDAVNHRDDIRVQFEALGNTEAEKVISVFIGNYEENQQIDDYDAEHVVQAVLAFPFRFSSLLTAFSGRMLVNKMLLPETKAALSQRLRKETLTH
jgi:hypothetical protein